MDTKPFEFKLDSKAATVEEESDGSVIIEGLATDWGEDRQEEAFLPNAFDEGVETFMKLNPVLLYHHDFTKALGRVLDLRKTDKGWVMKAKVDKPASGSWAEDVVNKIKTGTIRGLSVAGKFHRVNTPSGPRIHKAELLEISVTPMPVNPRTLFQVTKKALDSFEVEEEFPSEEDVEKLMQLAGAIEKFEKMSQRFVK